MDKKPENGSNLGSQKIPEADVNKLAKGEVSPDSNESKTRIKKPARNKFPKPIKEAAGSR